jgi:hypothetical protein
MSFRWLILSGIGKLLLHGSSDVMAKGKDEKAVNHYNFYVLVYF